MRVRTLGHFGDAPTLSQGDSGSAVQTLQNDLNALGYGPLTVDGQFGPSTESALTTYQSDQGLTVSGQADQATWDALSASPLSSPTPTANTPAASSSSPNILTTAVNWLSNPLPASSVTATSGAQAGGFDWKLIAAVSALGLGGAVLLFGVGRNLFKRKKRAPAAS